MIISILKYIPRALFLWMILPVTVILSPVICLPMFVYRAEESTVTGYPSQFPGKLREHIVPWLSGFSTFDDCADAHWYSRRTQKLNFFGWKPFINMTDEDFENSGFVRYISRIFWMCRNPAYGFAHKLGYNQHGIVDGSVVDLKKINVIRDEDYLWDSGYGNTSLRTTKNSSGQRAFLFEHQMYWFGSQWCLELVLGYKFPWKNDRANKAMVATRIIPFKRYERIVPRPAPRRNEF